MVADEAVWALSDRQSSWRPAEIVREAAALIPTTLAATAGEVVALVDAAGFEHGVRMGMELSPPPPAGVPVRVSDERPITESATDRALTMWWILREEHDLIDWADHRRGLHVHTNAHTDAHTGVHTQGLNAAQTEAALAVAGTEALVMIVGPAGTGKTTALLPAVAHMLGDGRVVFGVAPSATAADVLARETGMRADTVDKLLTEHRRPNGPRPEFDLPAGATVIVDEAGMISTVNLSDLTRLADQRGWRVALVGDPLQFSSVGRGGMFGLLVDTFGAIELDEVHRFTNPWERDASLQLRNGNPAVADTYDAHGRLHGGTTTAMERQAVNAWWKHHHAGDSVLLMAPSCDAVHRLNQRAQDLRIHHGDLTPDTWIQIGETRFHVGDHVITRHNDRNLRTDHNDSVRNRAQWTITHLDDNGTITVTGAAGTVGLPFAYVCEHLELGYATTGMGAQGRTVDHAITYLDTPTDIRNLYVPMTRGRHSNQAYVVVEGDDSPADTFARNITNDWIDQPAHQRRAGLSGPKRPVPDRPGLEIE